MYGRSLKRRRPDVFTPTSGPVGKAYLMHETKVIVSSESRDAKKWRNPDPAREANQGFGGED